MPIEIVKIIYKIIVIYYNQIILLDFINNLHRLFISPDHYKYHLYYNEHSSHGTPMPQP